MSRTGRYIGIPVLGMLAAAAFLILEHARKPSPWPPEPRKTTSGAMEALDLWAKQRAYPNPVVPDVGHALAYQESRQVLSAAGGPAHPIDELVPPWISLGPANIGGRTLALAVRPDDPDILYAGSASGGLWRSASGGMGADAWDLVETGFPVLGVGAIAIDSSDPDVLYIGTGEVYRYQNSTGGDVDRTTRGSYGIGILKSLDAGATWSMSLDWRNAQTRGVWNIRIHPFVSDIVYAATTEGVYKSTDAGGTWSRVLDVVMATDLRIHPVSPETVLVACGNFGSPGHGIYRTANGGTSWTRVSAGLPAAWTGKAMIDIAPSAPNIVYASISNVFVGLGLYRSFDTGQSWARVNTTDIPQYQGWYSHYVLVSPANVNRIFLGGIELWRSLDGGGTVTQVSDIDQLHLGTPPPGEPGGGPQYAHADHHFAVWHPTDPNTVFFASDGGVFKSVDGGNTFVGLNGGYVTTQFYQGFSNSASTPSLAIGGMQDNLTAIYEGDPAWRRVIGGDGNWAAVDPRDDRVLYGSAQVLTIFRSEDGGENWTEISPPNLGEATAFIAPYVLAPSRPDRIYAGRARVYRSENRGANWTATNGGAPLDGANAVFSLAVSTADPDLVFAVTAPGSSRGKVFRSRNAGATWTDVTGALPDRFPTDVTLDPGNDDIVFVTLGGFGASHAFYSTDQGDTWFDMGGGLPDVPASTVEVDPAHPAAIYVGTDLGVFYSPYYGRDWYPFWSGMPTAAVNDLEVVPGTRRIRAVTHGNGVYERDLLELSLTGDPGDRAMPGPGMGLRVAPNPMRADGRVSFTLREPAFVRLALYDVAGREVETLAEGPREAGDHDVSVRVPGLARGVYFIRLQAGDRSAITPLVFLK